MALHRADGLNALAPLPNAGASTPLLVRAGGAFGGLRASASALAAGPVPSQPYSSQLAKTKEFRKSFRWTLLVGYRVVAGWNWPASTRPRRALNSALSEPCSAKAAIERAGVVPTL